VTQHKLIIIKQNGQTTEWGEPDDIRARYIDAEREVMLGVRKPPYNHTVAVFRIDEVGDLLEGYSIKGPL
jgi:hypothetical protein